MRFLYPEFLYLMLIPAVLLFYLVSTNKDALERVFEPKALERLRISGDALGRAGHNLLAFAAFFFMTLALAEPVIERGETKIKSRAPDMVIALDLSRSMSAADFYPDRLTFAKQKLEEILPKLPAGRIGVVGFTSAAFVIAPLTDDIDTIRFLLRRVKPQSVSAEGTDLAAAIRGAARLLRKSGTEIVLLVTDGGDEKDLGRLRKVVEESSMVPIVWMTATERGAPIVTKGGRLLEDERGEPVISRANTALADFAAESGGIYVEATVSQEDEERIVSYLETLSATAIERERIVHGRIELFYYPLFLAVLILPFALYSFGGRERVSTMLFLAASSLLFAAQDAGAGIMDFKLIEKGERAYLSGDYNRSIEAFEKLSMSLPKNEVWFDLAGSYYKSGRYKRALQTYRKIVTDDRKLEMAKLYSMANCYVKLGELQKGADLYRKVLEMGEDADARANLELVMKILRERKKRKKSGLGEGDESRERKDGGSAAKESERSSSKPGGKKGEGRPRKLSEAEEKKWMRLIQNRPLKSKLYPLIPPEEDIDAKKW